ncbi:MAG: hypothetical protein WBC03_10900 [Albidovulum sp.]
MTLRGHPTGGHVNKRLKMVLGLGDGGAGQEQLDIVPGLLRVAVVQRRVEAPLIQVETADVETLAVKDREFLVMRGRVDPRQWPEPRPKSPPRAGDESGRQPRHFTQRSGPDLWGEPVQPACESQFTQQDQRPEAKPRTERRRRRMHRRDNPKPRRRFRNLGRRRKPSDRAPCRAVKSRHRDRVEIGDRDVDRNSSAERMGDQIGPTLTHTPRLGRAQACLRIKDPETCPDFLLRGQELALKRGKTLRGRKQGFEHRHGGAK